MTQIISLALKSTMGVFSKASEVSGSGLIHHKVKAKNYELDTLKSKKRGSQITKKKLKLSPLSMAHCKNWIVLAQIVK